MKDILSRRDFLKIAGIAVGGLTAGGFLGAEVWNDTNAPHETAKVAGVVGKDKLTDEIKKQFEEIIQYRMSLGLNGIPEEMSNLKGNKWEGASTVFENDLPNDILSYGEYTSEVISKLFGRVATRLVKGAKNDSISPGAISFNQADRFCIFSLGVHDISIDDDFINYILHEAGGHGSDPAVPSLNYPDETLIKVEHGKWLALTQMFSIPNEFLNNPGDLMYPTLKKQLGEVVGKAFVDTRDLGGVLDEPGNAEIGQTIRFIADGLGKEVAYLKFNKRVCSTIGSQVVQLVLKRAILLKGDLAETYSSVLGGAVAREIYAEMVRYAVLYPEKVNGVVVDGIREVLSAINGQPVDLEKLRADVIHPGGEILGRNFAESLALKQLASGEKATVLSSEEMALIAEQQAEAERQEQLFQEFLKNGSLPGSLNVPASMADTVKRFSYLYLEMEQRFPRITSIDILHDDNFDPDMNLWDIEDMAYALDQPFIRGLIQASTISEQVYGEILKKTKILEYLYDTAPFYVVYGKG